MFIYLNKKAQSTAEYVIVLGLIVAAVVGMQTYIKRGLQGRIRNAADFTGAAGDAKDVVSFDGRQYEPYYLGSNFESDRNSTESEKLLDGGAVQRDLTAEHSSRKGDQTISATGTDVDSPNQDTP